MAYVGLDPLKFLELKDPIEIETWTELQKRLMEIKETEMNNLAKSIAREVNKMFKPRG